MNSKPMTEERIWAAASHLAALTFGMGILLPIVGWSEQRQKSKYVSFQCLQALGYQTLGYTVWLLSYLLGMILFLVFMVIVMNFTKENSPWAGPASMLWTGLVLFFAFSLFAIYMLIPVTAAGACGLGKDFHYPLLGKRLAAYLGYQPIPANEDPAPLIEEHEYRWVASMGHFSVIIVFWGLLAPVTTWILQGRHSTFLRFQSIQTVIYQILVNGLYLGMLLLSFLGTIPLFAFTGLEGSPDPASPLSMVGLIFFMLTMLVSLVFLLLIPLFHILGQWAGYRVLKGDNYRNPLLGKTVAKRLTESYGVQDLAPGESGRPYGHDEPLDSTKEIS